jgi:hypothetical protein
MKQAREEVLALAQAIFGESRLQSVVAVLDEYGAERHEREVDRVKLAILRISAGDMDKLSYWVRIAKVDYRDVLAAEETGPLSPEDGAKLQAKSKNVVDRWGKK